MPPWRWLRPFMKPSIWRRVEGLPPVRDAVGPQLQGPDGGRRPVPGEGRLDRRLRRDRPGHERALQSCLGVGAVEVTAVAEALRGICLADALRLLAAAEVPAAASVLPAQVTGDAQVIDREIGGDAAPPDVWQDGADGRPVFALEDPATGEVAGSELPAAGEEGAAAVVQGNCRLLVSYC